jgi:hypothetical protein
VLISGTWATVELHAEATAKGGWAFDNQYCWLLEFRHGLVQVLPVSVRQLKLAWTASDMEDIASSSLYCNPPQQAPGHLHLAANGATLPILLCRPCART